MECDGSSAGGGSSNITLYNNKYPFYTSSLDDIIVYVYYHTSTYQLISYVLYNLTSKL